MDIDSLRRIDGLATFLVSKLDEDPERVAAAIVQTVVEELGGPDIPIESEMDARVMMNAASVLVNAAERTSNIQLLEVGEIWMALSAGSEHLVGTPDEARARYNLANSQLGTVDAKSLPMQGEVSDAETRAAKRWAHRDRLRLVRSGFSTAADLDTEGHTEGMALCNLANTLDHSGRWIEAYEAYTRALKADPTNGNAAGNAAVLIDRAIQSGWDFEGHLCSLYDHYLTMAHANRDRTIEVAGEGAAARFDQMQLLGSHEMLHQVGASDDDYQQWIIDHRLALTASLEGLGKSDREGRWDTANIRQVTTPVGQETMPPIFALVNLLKADFLVARRLAFDTTQRIATSADGWKQEASDPGVYSDTLDYSIYGTLSSSLVLAHRAAIDMLDKTAVAANEHFEVGDDPQYVSFRRFWTRTVKGGSAVLRPELFAKSHLASSVLAMAELAHDMLDDGIYAHAQEVRHAGTHRFVLVHHSLREIETNAAVQAIDLNHMVETTMQALSVARAAFLYLVSMVDVDESIKQRHSDGLVAPIHVWNVS
jgi:tetratricopeptide (TPR) repeat protein